FLLASILSSSLPRVLFLLHAIAKVVIPSFRLRCRSSTQRFSLRCVTGSSTPCLPRTWGSWPLSSVCSIFSSFSSTEFLTSPRLHTDTQWLVLESPSLRLRAQSSGVHTL